ncbi:UNVERIFIED_CONTAM: hypothetical protein Scaly_1455200 [Sesamum calycinum]|uniref:Reverse transcriptase zinc-binding domain-containing protein n=1 Tax=Sesamum calycinum TaxID=2727403 RepID=A0AAW2PNF5_9LAMI
MDLLVWHYSCNGLFSVRSAYHLALARARPASSSGIRWSHQLWSKIWQAHMPNKAKVFIWRAIRNIFPTASNLHKRMPHEVFYCPMCKEAMETPLHTFLRCSFARQVWALSNFQWSSINSADLEDWVHALSCKLSPSDFSLVVMTCWTIWWTRNLKLAHKHFLYPLQVIDFAATYLTAFQSQKLRNEKIVMQPQPLWVCPPTDCIKINFDGGLLDGGRALGIGIIARNAEGSCVAWQSFCWNRGGSTEMAEALAAREAIRLALRFRCPRVILEGDNKVLINKLASNPIVVDVLHLSSFFISVSFSFVGRLGNSAADLLAGTALNQEGDASLLPPGLEYVLHEDIAY